MITSTSPARIVAEIITNSGVGSSHESNNWPVFVGNEPAEPANTITLYDTPGFTEGRNQRSFDTTNHPGIQVRVRAEDYATGWTKIKQIHETLKLVADQTLQLNNNTYQVAGVHIRSGPIPIGEEAGRKRRLFTSNYITTIKET